MISGILSFVMEIAGIPRLVQVSSFVFTQQRSKRLDNNGAWTMGLLFAYVCDVLGSITSRCSGKAEIEPTMFGRHIKDFPKPVGPLGN